MDRWGEQIQDGQVKSTGKRRTGKVDTGEADRTGRRH